MNINFRLQPDTRIKKERSIFVRVGGKPLTKRIEINTNQKVFSIHWDNNVQRVIRTGKNKHINAKEINSVLESIILQIEEVVRIVSLDTKSEARHSDYEKAIRDIFKTEEPIDDFFKVLDLFLEVRQSQYSKNTIQNYQTLKKHLHDFQKITKYKITFDNINLTFEDKFVNYLQQTNKLTNSTKAKNMSCLKSFLNWALEREIHANTKFKVFSTKEDKTEIIFLTESELKRIIELDLSTHCKLDKIRDVFVFQCLTGQRYSDIKKLEWSNIKQNSIEIRIVKTRDIISIPLTQETRRILDKYKELSRPLPIISNQKYNDYLSEICQLAKIDEMITKTWYIGKERVEKTVPKSQLISSHKARSTFVTLSLMKGMNMETIMRITGHKDMKMMKKYLKITQGFVQSDYEKAWGK